MTQTQPASNAVAQAQSAAGQHDTWYVFRGEEGVKGPDGKGHDAFVPSSLVAKVGQPVTLSVINYDEGGHTITCDGLNLDQQIQAGIASGNDVKPVTTTFTFTPQKAGVFRWVCNVKCDKGGNYWAMTDGYDGPGQDGFMAGFIVVI